MNIKNRADCVPCEAESFTRNNYFTGKLMVERDFTDEQRYFMEKIRLHHQRLHGSGVVCGLQVIAHEEPCDDRYVILQPGSAVDCCGKDILVTEPDVIDLYAFAAMQELIAEAEAAEEAGGDLPLHRLQLCIRYRECPSENIPVLYDECGCDDTRCAPNRILESYDVDLLVDPEIPQPLISQPALDWATTLSIAHAQHVYLHEASNRLYVITEGTAGVVYQISTNNFAVEASFSLGRRGLALTTNTTGEELYIVVANAGDIGGGDAELWVFDVTDAHLADGINRQVVVANSDNSPASALCLADDRLLLLFHIGGRLRLWDAGLAAPMNPVTTVDHGVDLAGLSAASALPFVYSAEPGGSDLHRFDLDEPDFAPTQISGAVDTATDRVSHVATVTSSGPDLLVVTDNANNEVRLVDPAGPSVLGSVALAHPPVDVVVTSGGHCAYVLVADGDDAFIQSINVHELRQGEAVTASLPAPVGDNSQALAITTDGARLFIPYLDDLAVDNAGGVAVIDISETNCRDLLWPGDCPGCETPDCLILATIENYRPGFRLLDMPVPPPDALNDLADGIARLDNRAGRKRLPSTEAIVAALECLLENCCNGGGGGEQGPPGPPGPAGENGEDGAAGENGEDGADGRSIGAVEVTMVPCGQPASGQVVEVGDDLVLVLEIPGNCDSTLAHLCNINWFHNGFYQGDELNELLVLEDDRPFLRFLIRFDAPVRADDLNLHTVRATVSPLQSAVYQILGLHLVVRPGVFHSPDCELEEFERGGRIDTDFVNGAEILAPVEWIAGMERGFTLRFSIHGDFIRDREDRGADLNHLPLWLSNQNPAEPTAKATGDGVPGGEFVSWFSYARQGISAIGDRPPEFMTFAPDFLDRFNGDAAVNRVRALAMLRDNRLAVNHASVEELTTLPGIGPELAQAIVSAREVAPIQDEAGLLAIPGIGRSLLGRIREHITFDGGD